MSNPLPNPVLEFYDANGALIADRTTTGVRSLRNRRSGLPSRRRTISNRPLWPRFAPGDYTALVHDAATWHRRWVGRSLQPRARKAGCLARTRTLTKRSRISRATITPRGIAKGRELSPGRASAQVTTRRASLTNPSHRPICDRPTRPLGDRPGQEVEPLPPSAQAPISTAIPLAPVDPSSDQGAQNSMRLRPLPRASFSQRAHARPNSARSCVHLRK